MNLCFCQICNDPIDEDKDPGCLVERGNMRRFNKIEIVCEPCRFKHLTIKDFEEERAARMEYLLTPHTEE